MPGDAHADLPAAAPERGRAAVRGFSGGGKHPTWGLVLSISFAEDGWGPSQPCPRDPQQRPTRQNKELTTSRPCSNERSASYGPDALLDKPGLVCILLVPQLLACWVCWACCVCVCVCVWVCVCGRVLARLCQLAESWA